MGRDSKIPNNAIFIHVETKKIKINIKYRRAYHTI